MRMHDMSVIDEIQIQNSQLHVSGHKALMNVLLRDDFVDYIKKNGLADEPVIIKALSKIGKLYGEDKIRGEAKGNMGNTPDELRSELDSIMKNPGYWDPTAPNHNSLVKKFTDINKQLFPS